MAKTKIISTLGPASDSSTVIREMIVSGVDVVRLNFSHGTHPEHKARIDLVRKLNKKYRRSVKILQDLEGYRIRIGKLKDKKGVELRKRQQIFFTNNDILGSGNMLSFDYKGRLSDIPAGSHIYIDDGNIDLIVNKSSGRFLRAEVVVPGVVYENKGVNIPLLKLRFKGLTYKDKFDIQFGIKYKVDYIAQSFVRTKMDIMRIREFIKRDLPDCKIIAKIENREGIKNIDQILKVSDGIMIARGDMGVSIPIYEIPIVQKEIIKKCNKAGKPVITATQMLESMTVHLRPTRAEVTDVANAIIDGSDYLMLSAETAVGEHPVDAVKMMNRIIKFTEKSVLSGRVSIRKEGCSEEEDLLSRY